MVQSGGHSSMQAQLGVNRAGSPKVLSYHGYPSTGNGLTFAYYNVRRSELLFMSPTQTLDLVINRSLLIFCYVELRSYIAQGQGLQKHTLQLARLDSRLPIFPLSSIYGVSCTLLGAILYSHLSAAIHYNRNSGFLSSTQTCQ
jgi:hypothetical protein